MLNKENELLASQRVDLGNYIRRAQNGDQNAFTQLDDYLRPRLLKFFSKSLPAEHEDLTQTTLMQVFSTVDEFRFSEEGSQTPAFMARVFTIGQARLNDLLR